LLGSKKNRIGFEKELNKLGLSSAKLHRAKFGCIEVMFEVVSKDNLN